MPRVAVLGAGYAGLAAAGELSARAGAGWRIVLIDRHPSHELTTRLPRVLSGLVSPERARIPYRALLARRVQFVEAEIAGIDLASRAVTTTAGTITFEWLVLALGAVPGDRGVRGVPSFARLLKTVDGALALRHCLLSPARPSATRVVVVGGGYTGTEVAGELSVWRPEPPEITIVAEDSALLPGGNVALSRIAERLLSRRGVRFRLGERVAALEAGRVHLANGGVLPADVVLWAAPSVAAPVVRALAQPGSGGRVKVAPDLRAHGLERFYAIGDDATVTQPDGSALPSSAQVAVLAGIHAARNILLEAVGRPPTDFRPRLLGEALTLGGDTGAAEALGGVVTGRAALALKRAALARYLYRLGGTKLARRYLNEQ